MAPRFRIAAGLGVLLVLSAASLAAAAGPPPAGAKVVIVGGTAAQQHLARLTALRVGGVTLSRIMFRAPTPILHHMHVHGIELVVASRGKDTVRSEWEQELYVGAYLGLMARWPKATVAAAAARTPKDLRRGCVRMRCSARIRRAHASRSSESA